MRLLIAILLFSATATAQDTVPPPRFQLNGYVKDLQSLTWQNNMTNLVTGNLIHNRINARWLPSQRITAALELRNRLFWGEEVALTPAFSSRLRNANEAFDLTVNWLDDPRMVLNTAIDRLWAEYRAESWNLRLGRQRINWGIGTTWNPNDLFNTFNFLDFDYEERPGADAVRFQYLTGAMSHVELAVSVSEDSRQEIAAAKYFTNVANYDLQFIGGWFQEQFTLGAGWSGSLGETGFKGEIQYFLSRDAYRAQLNMVMEADYVFEKGWYVSAGMLFNNIGIDEPLLARDIAIRDINPRNLMPTKWNTVFAFSKEITPLISVTSTAIYTPGTDLLIVLPAFTLSVAENLDADVVWQSFFGEGASGFNDIAQRAFLRMKWSF